MSADPAAPIAKAATLYQKGDLAGVEKVCRTALKQSPHEPTLLHLLGLSLFGRGEAGKAIPHLRKAVETAPNDAGLRNTLGIVLMAAGDVPAAEQSLTEAVTLQPLLAEAWSNLGDCRLRRGQVADAATALDQALALAPTMPQARLNRAQAWRQANKPDQAIAVLQSLLADQPAYAIAWRNLGHALMDAERYAHAIEAFDRFLSAAPGDRATESSKGHALFQLGRYEDALTIFDALASAQPADADSHNNRGLVLRSLGRIDEAADAFRQALVCDPELVAAATNLGNVLHDRGDLDGALTAFAAAIETQPNAVKPHLDRAFALMIEGRLAEAIPDLAWRFEGPAATPRRQFPYPQWRGEDLAGTHILLWGEQGVGDEIMHAAAIGAVLAKAGHVTLECDPRLTPLFARSFPGATVVARQTPPAPLTSNGTITFQAPMGDLLPRLYATKADMPRPNGYLEADAEMLQDLRAMYRAQADGKRLVGLSWHSARHGHGRSKSVPLIALEPLLSEAGLAFVNLQYGDHADEIAEMLKRTGATIIEDPSVDPLADLDRFAAQVAAMDTVLSVSNTTAHMAGALGVSTHVLIPRLGTGSLLWYWGRTGDRSPLYPGVRLHRQQGWQDWEEAIASAASALKA